jgi:phosphoribosylglycinamide formyltransferase-1
VARLKAGVLISGRGTNLQALVDAAADPTYPAEVALVISNVAEAFGLERAAAAGIPTQVIDHRAHPSRTTFEGALSGALHAAGCELVCLAGFMRLLSGPFVERWWNRLINIHPSLLPAFRGLNAHEKVLASGARFTGCTVHFVRLAMDDGPIIVQAVVPVLPDDDVERLAARVLVQEHRIYPLAVRLIADGRVRVEDGRVIVDRFLPAQGVLINPVG